MPKNNEILEGEICNKIYNIRGEKVMLDRDLAEIYGYTTSAFNQQVKNNIEKFEGEDFMFQLSPEEIDSVSISKNLISKNLTSSWGGVRKSPYAFTEQGIYMLMTVLKGELATKQSRTLIRLFKAMKDHIIENQSIVSKVIDNSKDIVEMKTEIKKINNKINDTIKKSEISPILLDFTKLAENKEYLLLNGKPIRAKEAYMRIYSKARNSIYIIDNYVDIKTLHLLQDIKPGTEVIFFTDNAHKYLRKFDLDDFRKERPDLKINFITANKLFHDRFIIIDEKKLYHAGSSSKDAGIKMTTILEMTDKKIGQYFIEQIKKLKDNPRLILE